MAADVPWAGDSPMDRSAAWDEESRELLEKWLFRHGHPLAVTLWRAAPRMRARGLAAVAVAQDPGLLLRMDPSLAVRLAEDALDGAEQVLGAVGGMAATPGAAAAICVVKAVRDWLCQRRTGGGRA
jgi:hypothetical protein